MVVNFFTAIKYALNEKTIAQSMLENVDSYFYLGGKKAHVINESKSGEEVVLSETHVSGLAKFCKIATYFTLIAPFLMLIAKAILRSTHTFKVIDPQKKLEMDINVNSETISKLQRVIPKILNNEPCDEIESVRRNQGSWVFKLNDAPNLVFRLDNNHPYFSNMVKTDQLFSNMVKAEEVYLANNLEQLIIPHAKKIDIEVNDVKHTLIATESLDYELEESANEELYQKYSKELDKTARQLATFVVRAQMSEVSWSGIPILNTHYIIPNLKSHIEALGEPKYVVLSELGSIGKDPSLNIPALIGCVSKDQIDVVIDEARKQGVAISQEILDAKARRLQALESDERLQKFYNQNNIKTGKEPIIVELDSLGLNLEASDKYAYGDGIPHSVTMKRVAEDVLKEINDLIQNSSDHASIKGKRHIRLDIHKDDFAGYVQLPADATQEEQLWMYQILQALKQKGQIFEFSFNGGHGFLIQA